MANSTRNGTQRRLPSKVNSGQQDWTETGNGEDGPNGELKPTAETPNLWHGGAQRECWTSSGATESASWGSPFAACGRPALRLQRPPRRRTLLHCSRPSQGAAARFFSPRFEHLAD